MRIQSITRKLPLAILALALVVGAGVGASGYLIASRTAEDLTFARLEGVAADRSALLKNFLQSRELSVLTASRSETVKNALRDLHFGWIKLGEAAEAELISAYVANNPYPAGERDELDDAGLGTNYDSAHIRIHPALRVLAESAGFEDIYLFDEAGHCVYSVTKGPDFAATFNPDTELGISLLGELLMRVTDTGAVVVSDVAFYAPAGAPSAFMAAPVLDKIGSRLGTVAVKLPIAGFGALINGRDGLGTTGEVLIAGVDMTLRNNSVFTEGQDVLTTELDSPSWRQRLRAVGPARGRSHRTATKRCLSKQCRSGTPISTGRSSP